MPKIVLIEPDWMEAEDVAREIHDQLPGTEVIVFKNFSEFLLGLDAIAADISLIVTEDRLSLMIASEDYDRDRADIEGKFPDMFPTGREWQADEVLGFIFKHLENRKVEVPIVVYTHSSEEWISSQIGDRAHATYLLKGFEVDSLIAKIRQILGV